MTILEGDSIYEEIWNSCGLQIMKARVMKVDSSLSLRIEEQSSGVDLSSVSKDIFGSIL